MRMRYRLLRCVHQRVVQQAKEVAIIAGKKLRTDTTAVETNIHHPTELLSDSLRVMLFATHLLRAARTRRFELSIRLSGQTSSVGDRPEPAARFLTS
jgi:hypothetical protein